MELTTLNRAFKRIYDPPKRGWHSKKKRQFKKVHKKYINFVALINGPSLLDLILRNDHALYTYAHIITLGKSSD